MVPGKVLELAACCLSVTAVSSCKMAFFKNQIIIYNAMVYDAKFALYTIVLFIKNFILSSVV